MFHNNANVLQYYGKIISDYDSTECAQASVQICHYLDSSQKDYCGFDVQQIYQ